VVNIINPEDIDEYLYSFASEAMDHHSEIYNLLHITVRRSISKDQDNLVKIAKLPQNAPEWMQNQWDVTGNNFYEFRPAHNLTSKITHIKDWLVSAKHHNEAFLQDLDNKGRPRSLVGMDIDSAYNAADRYFAKLNKKLKVKEEKDDTKTIMTFDDGYKIVQMLTENALDCESQEMGHCIGHGSYDAELKSGDDLFYSLRDANNKAHATLHVQKSDNSLLQCKGKENNPPVTKYLSYIQGFVEQKDFKLEEDPSHTGLIKQDGQFYNVFALPNNFSIKGELNLSAINNLTHLPNNLSVDKDLFLTGCGNLTHLAYNLSVQENLYLLHCYNLKELPKGLKVKGKIFLPDGAFCETVQEAQRKFKIWHADINALGCKKHKPSHPSI